MEDYIPISTLNDFVFCPYSIYLHNIYMSADDGLYHAVPQLKGRSAHNSLDDKTYSSKKNDTYYRCFMGCKSVLNYPKFIFR